MSLSLADQEYIKQWASGKPLTEIRSTVFPNPNKGIFGDLADDTGQAGQRPGGGLTKPKQPKQRSNPQGYNTAGPAGESDQAREDRIRKSYNLPPKKQ